MPGSRRQKGFFWGEDVCLKGGVSQPAAAPLFAWLPFFGGPGALGVMSLGLNACPAVPAPEDPEEKESRLWSSVSSSLAVHPLVPAQAAVGVLSVSAALPVWTLPVQGISRRMCCLSWLASGVLFGAVLSRCIQAVAAPALGSSARPLPLGPDLAWGLLSAGTDTRAGGCSSGGVWTVEAV